MSLNKRLTLNFLILFFVFFLSSKSCFADEMLNITIFDLEPPLEVMQGECKAAPFHIINQYNESVLIYYMIEKPLNMDITSFPNKYTQVASGATIAGNLNVCVNESLEKNTYNVSFWVETLTKVGENRVKSDKYILGVKVLNNPEITTTTTTSNPSSTSTSTTSTSTTTTVKSFDISIEKPSIGNITGGEKLGTIVVIVIALVLIMIPYLTFIRGRKAKTGG